MQDPNRRKQFDLADPDLAARGSCFTRQDVMQSLGLFLRYLAKLQFRMRNRATIKDIPKEEFNLLVEELLSFGWKVKYQYHGFDAWIDYGKVNLQRTRTRLIFEWDNWTEASIEGPAEFIEKFAEQREMIETREWRWAEYDQVQF